MTDLAACQTRLAIQTQANRCLKNLMEEQEMVSSSADLILRAWKILESQTSSAFDWFRKCSAAASPQSEFRMRREGYGGITGSDVEPSIEGYYELEEELVPLQLPEREWKPIRTKLVMVKKFQLNLEP